MTMPACPYCHHPLDRIDHYGIEHLILRDDIYRPVGIDDGDSKGGCGLASEVDLRCGRCGEPVPRESREYFYRRWYQVLALREDGS